MNELQNSTVAAPPAMPDFKAAFDGLNDPISLVLRRAKALDYLVCQLDDRKDEEGRAPTLHPEELDAIWTLMQDVRDAAEALDRLWEVTNVARCKCERMATFQKELA